MADKLEISVSTGIGVKYVSSFKSNKSGILENNSI